MAATYMPKNRTEFLAIIFADLIWDFANLAFCSLAKLLHLRVNCDELFEKRDLEEEDGFFWEKLLGRGWVEVEGLAWEKLLINVGLLELEYEWLYGSSLDSFHFSSMIDECFESMGVAWQHHMFLLTSNCLVLEPRLEIHQISFYGDQYGIP
nr:hypothetical protein Iba_chr07dCG3440 [Ipomoea batatas]